MDGKKRKTNYITGGCVCTGEVVYIRTAYEKASENDCQALGATRTSLGTPEIRRSRSESSCIGEKKSWLITLCVLPVRAAPHVPPLAYVKPSENDFATLGTTKTRYGTR